MTPAKAAEGRRTPRRCRAIPTGGCVRATQRPSRLCGWLCGWLVFVLWCFSFAGEAAAQSTATNAPVRFRAVDVFLDSKEQPLAAYQLEFAVTNGIAKIVGIEGGEHAAFAQPPFYDPKAMQHERVIIAAFSTEAVEKLPKGKTRIVTIHLQTSGKTEPSFATSLQTAGGANGRRIEATASSVEREVQ